MSLITTTAPAKPTASQSTVEQENVSAILAVAAPAARVFAVLADPTTHAAIDGTGWVQEAVDRAPLTEVGQIFRMDMHHAGHLDGDYRVVNKVEVLDPPRAIGWMTGTEKGEGELEFGGWIWRYDLAPLGPSGTEVTLTYDWSAVPQFIRERGIQLLRWRLVWRAEPPRNECSEALGRDELDIDKPLVFGDLLPRERSSTTEAVTIRSRHT